MLLPKEHEEKLRLSQFDPYKDTKKLPRGVVAELRKKIPALFDEMRNKEKSLFKDQMSKNYYTQQPSYHSNTNFLLEKCVNDSGVINMKTFKKEVIKIIYPIGYARPETTDTGIPTQDLDAEEAASKEIQKALPKGTASTRKRKRRLPNEKGTLSESTTISAPPLSDSQRKHNREVREDEAEQLKTKYASMVRAIRHRRDAEIARRMNNTP